MTSRFINALINALLGSEKNINHLWSDVEEKSQWPNVFIYRFLPATDPSYSKALKLLPFDSELALWSTKPLSDDRPGILMKLKFTGDALLVSKLRAEYLDELKKVGSKRSSRAIDVPVSTVVVDPGMLYPTEVGSRLQVSQKSPYENVERSLPLPYEVLTFLPSLQRYIP